MSRFLFQALRLFPLYEGILSGMKCWELCQVIMAWFLLYYNDRANHCKGAKRIGIMSSNLHGFYIWELCQVISELCQVIKNSLISGVLEASELCQVIWELCQVIENAK